jgi:glutathione S-transferase
MTAYRLHYFPASGNSCKLALMLAFCGQAFGPVWTDFGGGITRTAAWRESVNTMGDIPVLEDGAQRSTQTAPIVLRLSQRYGWFGRNTEDERFEILRWLFCDNHRLTGYMATYRFQCAFTPSPEPAGLTFLKRRIDDFLGILRCLATGPILRDRRPSNRGYLCFPPHESGCDLSKSHPAVSAWLSRFAAIPGWRSPYDLLPGKCLPCYVNS